MSSIIFFPIICILFILIYSRRRQNTVRDTFLRLIEDENDLEKFAEWAFGNGYEDLEESKLMEAWNTLHGKKLRLQPSGLLIEDADKMIKIWKQEKWVYPAFFT